jgi:hypothetical protein
MVKVFTRELESGEKSDSKRKLLQKIQPVLSGTVVLGFASVFGQEFHPKLDQSSRGEKGAETYRELRCRVMVKQCDNCEETENRDS